MAGGWSPTLALRRRPARSIVPSLRPRAGSDCSRRHSPAGPWLCGKKWKRNFLHSPSPRSPARSAPARLARAGDRAAAGDFSCLGATADPFEKNVHSLDNLSCAQIIPFAPFGGRAHFFKWVRRRAKGKENPPAAAGSAVLASPAGALQAGIRRAW